MPGAGVDHQGTLPSRKLPGHISAPCSLAPCLPRQCHPSLTIGPNCKNLGARGHVQPPLSPPPHLAHR